MTPRPLVNIAADSYHQNPAGVLIEVEGCHALIRQVDGSTLIGFRGSADTKDWFSNLDRHQIDAPDDIPGRVHRGFSDSLDLIWPQLVGYLFEDKGSPICLSGHSRGGAHATIAAARLVKSGHAVMGLHTYGSPRVGDKRFARYVTEQVADPRRYSFESDPVPRLPRWRYKHVGELWWRCRGEWYHKAGFIRRLGAFLFARRWPFVGDSFNDHRMENYVAAVGA